MSAAGGNVPEGLGLPPGAERFGSGAGGVLVRRAERRDMPQVWRLLGELARYEKLEEYLSGSADSMAAHIFDSAWPRIECLVAEAGDTLVGYAVFYGVYSTFSTRPGLWLEDLHVTESHRGRGIGRRLLAAVARVAVERGAPRVAWEVLDWNAPSIEFYERLGAARGGGWHNYRLSGPALEALAAGPSR